MQEEIEFDEGPATLESYTDDEMWYFDLPTGAWERQEEKNRTLRSQVRQNMEGRKGSGGQNEGMAAPMPRLHRRELPPMPKLAPGSTPVEERATAFAWRGDPEIEALIEEKYAKRTVRALAGETAARPAASDAWEFRPANLEGPGDEGNQPRPALRANDPQSTGAEHEWVAEIANEAGTDAADLTQGQQAERKGLFSRFLRKPKAGEPADSPSPARIPVEPAASRGDNPFFTPAPAFAAGSPEPNAPREPVSLGQLKPTAAPEAPMSSPLVGKTAPEAILQPGWSGTWPATPPTERPRAPSRLHARRAGPVAPAPAEANADPAEPITVPSPAVYPKLTNASEEQADKSATLGHARADQEGSFGTPREAAAVLGATPGADDDPWAEFLQDRTGAGGEGFRFTSAGRGRSE